MLLAGAAGALTTPLLAMTGGARLRAESSGSARNPLNATSARFDFHGEDITLDK